MIYSSQHLVFEPVPWVVDLEFVTGLVGYGSLRTYKRVLEKTLSSKFCKKIMPWTDAGKRTVLDALDCRRFESKIETVHLAVPPKRFVKSFSNDVVKLLFVGTGNKFNSRNSFELKGGREMLAAFVRLRKKYRNVTLTIRSIIPSRYIDFCRREGIRTLPHVLTPEQLRKEFEDADIFVFPGHQTPGTVILDAMSYELPVVATNLWGMEEMVADGKTGLLSKPSKFAKYSDEKHAPLWGEPSFLKSIERLDPRMITDIVDKVSYLIEHEDERRHMGGAGREVVEFGEFSITERNRKLLRIFNESSN
jgi:glycosyltransferase involved in cell wall biosynthesis